MPEDYRIKDRPDESQRDEVDLYATGLYHQAVECARRRQGIEEQWYEDTLHIQGYYDDKTRENLDSKPNSSKIFINQTRPKCNTMRDRLDDILWPKDEANWDIRPTPQPEMAKLASGAANPDAPEERKSEAAAARNLLDVAVQRRDAMHRRMSDQLAEADYASKGMRVVEQCVRLGTGVMKGPWTLNKKLKRWSKEGDAWKVEHVKDGRPMFEFVDLWDFFPDMDATEIEDCEYTFQLHRCSRRKLRRLAKTGDFYKDEVNALLKSDPKYSPIDSNFADYTRYIRALSDSTSDGQFNHYQVLEYHGPVPYDNLRMIAEKNGQGELLDLATNPDNPLDTYEAVVWFCQDRILKFSLKPTSDHLYSLVRFDRSDSSIFGIGVARMIRDPQIAAAAVMRLMMENGGLSGTPMIVLRKGNIEPVENPSDYSIAPGKLWYDTSDDDRPAIYTVSVEGSQENLKYLMELCLRFCDDETRLPLIAQGDPGAAAKQTAHGMSLLVNAVNMVFKSAAKRFDDEFTIPNIRRLYEWNMEFSKDEKIKGDMNVKALGSSVLLVRELQAQNLLMVLNLAATNPLIGDMVRIPTVARKLFQALQIDKTEIVLSDEELNELAAAKEGRPDPEVAAKLELERVRIEGQVQIEQMRMQGEMLKLALQSEMSLQKIAAELHKATIQMQSSERLMAAEAALKERHGTGI